VSGWNEPKGDVFLCCPPWLDTPIGNILAQSVEEIWNGKIAQEIRRSIFDGSFEYCDRSKCPFLQTLSGPVQRVEEVVDEDLKIVVDKHLTTLPYGPREINCAYDMSCNLHCPSCRTEVVVEVKNSQEILEIQNKIKKEALKEAHLLYITGSGDPFGSPFYRRWILAMKSEEMPCLRNIHIHTNALLWTPRMWNEIPVDIRQLIKSTEISIDAASPETYSVNRRGGTFEKLLKNLYLISNLRKLGPLDSVTISMVVQENNFMEMPDFVRLGKRHNFDFVYFSRLLNWGTYTEEDYRKRAIHLPNHPKHFKLIEILEKEIFKDPIVHLGNLSELIRH
jgi:MoaA/NifB/PqqE/SkfB family radical SAM enzyme